MIIPYWKAAALKARDRAQMLQQRHVDIQRLWKRFPQSPQMHAGRPSAQVGDRLSSRALVINRVGGSIDPIVQRWMLDAPACTHADGSTRQLAQIDYYDSGTLLNNRTQTDLRQYRLIILHRAMSIDDGPWRNLIESGYWTGRLVLCVAAFAGAGSGTVDSKDYINGWTSISGLTVGDLIDGVSYNMPDPTTGQSCDNSGTMNGSSPFADGCSGNITNKYGTREVSGGTWISKIGTTPTIWAAENTVPVGVGGSNVSFVVMSGGRLFNDCFDEAADKPFLQNLWSKPI